MNTATYKNIFALRSESGEIYGFHGKNMEVARLSEEAWQALERPEALKNAEALSELVSWDEEQSEDVTDLPSEFKVRSFSINIAQVCNLACVYCGADGDGTYGSRVAKLDVGKALEQIKLFVEKLNDGESLHLRLIGGEPLLYPSAVKEICRYTRLLTVGRDRSVSFSVITNGTLITPKVAELLAEFGFQVTVSVDATPEVNDVVRPLKSGGSSTALTLRGLKELTQVRNRLGAIKINCVFGSHNTDVVSSYRAFREFDVDYLNLNYAANDQDEDHSDLYLQQMTEIAKMAFASGGLSELRRIIQFKVILDLLEEKTRKWNHCGAGKSLLQTDTQGDLYVCNWFMNDKDEIVGKGTDIDKNKLKPYSKNLIELHDCQTCWARHLCGGGCMFVNRTKTGDKHTKDNWFCSRKKALSALSIKYFIEEYS